MPNNRTQPSETTRPNTRQASQGRIAEPLVERLDRSPSEQPSAPANQRSILRFALPCSPAHRPEQAQLPSGSRKRSRTRQTLGSARTHRRYRHTEVAPPFSLGDIHLVVRGESASQICLSGDCAVRCRRRHASALSGSPRHRLPVPRRRDRSPSPSRDRWSHRLR